MQLNMLSCQLFLHFYNLQLNSSMVLTLPLVALAFFQKPIKDKYEIYSMPFYFDFLFERIRIKLVKLIKIVI